MMSKVNPEHDNLDVHVVLEEFTFVVATPNNVFWCMENERIVRFSAKPMLCEGSYCRESRKGHARDN
jgi:hypothetical protein